MELYLKGKVVVITGGATGIGKAAALEFLKEGCSVAICGRRQNKLEEARSEARLLGYEMMIESVDVTDYTAMESFARHVEERYGKIDIWLNNAGSNYIKSMLDYTTEEFKRMVDVILVSVFSGCQIAARIMKKNGGGVILNASSFASVMPAAGRAPYAACKAGVSSLTRSFAAELAKDQIRVLSYIPGMIATDCSSASRADNSTYLMSNIPMRRFGTAEDLANVLVFLASERAAYMNGTDVLISGGKFCVQNPQYSYQD